MASVLLYVVFLGFEAEYMMNAALEKQPLPLWVYWGEVVFTAVYMFEVAVKLVLLRKDFFKKGRSYQKWNCFDLVLVAAAVVDIILKNYELSLGPIRAVRFFRILRFARVFRTVGMFHQLRNMVASLVTSMPTLLWALVLLALLLYFCSLLIMQGVQDHVQNDEGADDHALIEAFGSLGSTAMSMFMSISGGIDWGDSMKTLSTVRELFLPQTCFAVFVFFMSFAVNGVLTAVIIDASSGILSYDKDLAIQQHLNKEAEKREYLRCLFEDLDENKVGKLTVQQLKHALEQEKTRAFLDSIDMAVAHTHDLFQKMDKDRSGSVDREEFVDGLMNNRGVLAHVVQGNFSIDQKIAVVMELLGAREKGYDACVCGNIFMPDAAFCRKCAAPRKRRSDSDALIPTHLLGSADSIRRP